MDTLAFWRDIAGIILLIEAIVLILPFLILSYVMVRLLRALDGWLKPHIPVGQGYVRQGQDLTNKYGRLGVSVASRTIAAWEGLRTGTAYAFWRFVSLFD
ncbi:MAG: hypothetical protein EXR62_05815 [Chloroflexi bacterium]|nr:hypothetical protein [Chloroflexota bacterium]